MSEEIKLGDVVQLKSGGPDMTVNFKGEGNGTITCYYFNEGKVLHHDFKAHSLKIIK